RPRTPFPHHPPMVPTFLLDLPDARPLPDVPERPPVPTVSVPGGQLAGVGELELGDQALPGRPRCHQKPTAIPAVTWKNLGVKVTGGRRRSTSRSRASSNPERG